ncbi:hypothetical protein K9N50_07965 [bacterium]|nr:hypothetical protein [bacterium]
MKYLRYWVFLAGALVVLSMFLFSCPEKHEDLVRPEQIFSKRKVIYDKDTYADLAQKWKAYYKRFPSEDAYANWMYAARYAGDPKFDKLLQKGLTKYPGNPTILYLASCKEHGKHDYDIGRNYLERSAELDPSYMDPWFSLVIHYMDARDDERLDVALNNLLHSGEIAEEVMDYNYNTLMCLDTNALLITNGDNDTYPGWILTKLLNIRPDVKIVNRSLLNTDWYPSYIIERGVPQFISKQGLTDLRENIIKQYKEAGKAMTSGGLFGDTLIVRIIQEASKKGLPVYFAATLNMTEDIERYFSEAKQLGLVMLVTPPERTFKDDLIRVLNAWLYKFRTGGLQSWSLVHSKDGYAGRGLTRNYTAGLMRMSEAIKEYTPELVTPILKWYRLYCEELTDPDFKEKMAEFFPELDDIEKPVNLCPVHGKNK